MKQAELFHEARYLLAEGPLWDHENELYYWVDIVGKKVCSLEVESSTYREYTFEKEIGTIALTAGEELLLAMSDGVYLFGREQNSLRLLTNTVPPDSDQRYNDGKCDAAGRLIVGTTSLSGRERRGFLFQIEYSETMVRRETLLKEVSISNGLCWNQDNSIMYYIDSPTGQISAFAYDLSTGSLGRERCLARIPAEEGVPDGMTIDTEGRLYVAHWGGGRVSVWDSGSGKRVDEIAVPAPHVTSCTFGGRDLSELIISSARTDLSPEELKEYPLSGSMFRYQTDTRGRETHRFSVF